MKQLIICYIGKAKNFEFKNFIIKGGKTNDKK